MQALLIVVLLLFVVQTIQLPTDETGSIINKNEKNLQNHTTVTEKVNLSGDVIHEEDSHDRRRRKRFISFYHGQKPKNMMVLVVVDDSLVDFHGKDKYKLYVQAMMSVVDQAFHHPSLGREINVYLLHIHHLDKEAFKKIWAVRVTSNILKEFCLASSELKKSLNLETSVDVSVYLSRESFGPAGYAPVLGICQEARNCVLVTDTGLTSSFVVAHELGHSLGIYHDGEKNKCVTSTSDGDGRIMGTHVFSHFSSYKWSSCSRDYLERYLPGAKCLDDKPANVSLTRYADTYGQHWSLDEQCRQEFGNGYAFCPHVYHEYSCRSLSCYEINKYEGRCTTKKSPPIQGTICRPGKWCIKESCVKRTKIIIDGGWSQWQEWSKCSRTCGSGFQFRERTCNNPSPSEDGKPCKGPAEEFYTCNTEPCKNMTDFRAEQCSAHNYKTFTGDRSHEWVPIDNDASSLQCKLICISRNTRDTITDTLIDGTPCSYDNQHDRCFKESCKTIGCDGEMYSQKKVDQCGHCGGNGKKCQKIKGLFDHILPVKEYHHILVLPTNARNIIIRERHTKPHLVHYFGLRDTRTESWYLNGNLNQSDSHKLVINGAAFMYYSGKAEGESLSSKGPLLSPVDFWVYSMSNSIPAWIEYEYTLPFNDTPGFIITKEQLRDKIENNGTYDDTYIWAFIGWSNCSKSCEKGYQYELFVCVKKETGFIADGFCSQQKKVQDKRECNTHSCQTKYWWYSEDWSYYSCSASCGTGIQKRLVQCMKHGDNQNVKVSPSYCNQYTMPNHSRKCNTTPCHLMTTTTTETNEVIRNENDNSISGWEEKQNKTNAII